MLYIGGSQRGEQLFCFHFIVFVSYPKMPFLLTSNALNTLTSSYYGNCADSAGIVEFVSTVWTAGRWESEMADCNYHILKRRWLSLTSVQLDNL